MHPGRMLATMALLGVALPAAPARAREASVGVFTYGSPETAVAAARVGLRDAVADAGGARLRDLGRRAARRLERAAPACHLRAACLRRLARRLGTDLLVAEVRPRADGLALRYRLAPVRGRGTGGERAALDGDEVEAATYGLAFRALGGRGAGRLTVGTHGIAGEVRLGDAAAGPTPVVRREVPAGAVRVTVSAPGYLAWHRWVKVRPRSRVTIRATLVPNATAVPLAALVAPRPAAHAPPAQAPAASPAPATPPTAIPLVALGPPPPRAPPEAPPAPAAAPAPAAPEVALAPAPEAAPAPAPGAAPSPRAEAAAATAPAPEAVPAPPPPPDVSPATVARAADRADAEARPPATRLPEHRRRVGAGAWVTLGAGVAALATGAFFGVSAQGNAAAAANPMTSQPLVPGLNARMAQQATVANVLFAAGAAVTGLGTWLLVHDLTAVPATEGGAGY